ncbi:YdcH family protein [Sphingorhabdus arenilitoris]|uniref:YdcH family protein n=1 Tax=Sphingorhabdus arenilitoris TaxID=1490041 RepID=A0ABV8RJI5_9SPHN
MNDEGYQHQLETLRIEHRDLDDAISVLQEQPLVNQMQIARLKKKKLILKDQIRRLEDQLIPDIIA